MKECSLVKPCFYYSLFKQVVYQLERKNNIQYNRKSMIVPHTSLNYLRSSHFFWRKTNKPLICNLFQI